MDERSPDSRSTLTVEVYRETVRQGGLVVNPSPGVGGRFVDQNDIEGGRDNGAQFPHHLMSKVMIAVVAMGLSRTASPSKVHRIVR